MAGKAITDYRDVPSLRLLNPVAILQQWAQDDGGLTVAQYVKGLASNGAHLRGVSWEAIEQVVRQDAAAIDAILSSYAEPRYSDDTLAGMLQHKDRTCLICESGHVCRVQFLADAQLIAHGAKAPLMDVLRWMNELLTPRNTKTGAAPMPKAAPVLVRILTM